VAGAVLESLFKDYQDLIRERDAAELRHFQAHNEANELRSFIKNLKQLVDVLRTENQKAREGFIRGSFWSAVDNLLSIDEEIKELLEE
jgi:hypothetical protein